MTDFDARGAVLAKRLVLAINPVLQDEPGDLALQAMAIAMLAVISAAVLTPKERSLVLCRYAHRITQIVEAALMDVEG